MKYFDIDVEWRAWMGTEIPLPTSNLSLPYRNKALSPSLRADLSEKLLKRKYPERKSNEKLAKRLSILKDLTIPKIKIEDEPVQEQSKQL